MKVLSIVDFESEQENLDSKIKDAILYNEQLIPIRLNYKASNAAWTSNKTIKLSEYFNIRKGDKLFLRCDNKANGRVDCANSYTLINISNNNYSRLLNLIPYSGVGGKLMDELHFDAITQLKNLDKILKGELETEFENKQNLVLATEEIIPDNEFYISSPRNSDTGFNGAQKIIRRGDKYILLRTDHWVTNAEVKKHFWKGEFDEESYNNWGIYDKHGLAWYIYHNAYVILKQKDLNKENAYNKLWSLQYNLIRDRSIEMFLQKNK
jgi:hypothetical protein